MSTSLPIFTKDDSESYVLHSLLVGRVPANVAGGAIDTLQVCSLATEETELGAKATTGVESGGGGVPVLSRRRIGSSQLSPPPVGT